MSERILDSGADRRSTAITALVRVGAHFGMDLDAAQIRRAHPFIGDEPSPALLQKIAEKVGMRAQTQHVERGQLAQLERRTPAILLMNDGKSALLDRVSINDGACCALIDDLETSGGLTVLVDEPRLFDHWGGDVIVLNRRWALTDQERPFGLWWFFGQLVTERKSVRDICIAALMMGMLTLFPAMLFMLMIDRVLSNHSMETLAVLGVALIVVTAFDTLFGYVRRRQVLYVASRIDARINLHVFDRLLNLPMAFFERTPTGIVSGKIGQVWHIRQFLTGQLLGTMLDGLSLIILLPVLFVLNWKLALLVLALALVIMVVYILFLPSLRVRQGAVIAAEQAMGSHQIETIHGIRTVKMLSLEGLRRYQRDQLVARTVEAHQAFDTLANVPQTIVTPIDRLIYSGSFFLGCYMALNDPSGRTAGVVMAFAMLSGRVAAPIVGLAGLINSFEYARGALGEVASVMNVPAEEGRSGDGLKLPITGRVEFHDVRFRYQGANAFALDGVSFEIKAASIFGVMGRSGSGKTTVTRLLQGMNRDYEGRIKIDGMDLREMDLDHLRSSIGVVPQENFLFSGTVRDNIGAGRPNSPFNRIVRVAQLAGAEEFIERLPRGYDTAVEEGAVNFSGGQRQRMAIARALLLDPPILVLDEATSALDAESEAIVNANLLRIAQGRTVIIISHRLSSLMMADAILVMERGKFYDCGRHEELLARCDIYQSLWYQQNRHLEPKAVHARIGSYSTPAS